MYGCVIVMLMDPSEAEIEGIFVILIGTDNVIKNNKGSIIHIHLIFAN